MRGALADAVSELRGVGIPLDARLREWQYEMRGSDRIPIHGGPGTLGVFNAISAPFAGDKGFPDITSGSSFVMAAHLTGACPESHAILTYSLSANPQSPYFADQTRLYSQKRWLDMLFCEDKLLRQPLKVTEFGCISPAGFTRAGVGGRAGNVRLRYRRAVAGLPVTIDLLRAGRRGGLRRVAGGTRRFRRPLGPGVYVMRFTTRARTGLDDSRYVAFRVRAGRVVRLRRFAIPERCGLLRSARLSSPVLGRGAAVRLRLARRARVRVTVFSGRRVVLTRVVRGRAGVQKLRLDKRGLTVGHYRVRIVARAGKSRSRAVLYSTTG